MTTCFQFMLNLLTKNIIFQINERFHYIQIYDVEYSLCLRNDICEGLTPPPSLNIFFSQESKCVRSLIVKFSNISIYS